MSTLFLPVGDSDGHEKYLRVEVPLGGAYAIGQADAPVTVVEFGDFQCPFCARAHIRLAGVRDELLAAGTIRWVQMDLPLPNHANARVAASFARCAGDASGAAGFWKIHDELFLTQSAWSYSKSPVEHFSAIASRQGVSGAAVACALESGHDGYLNRAVDLARALRIPGTPAYFIGGLPVAPGVEPEEIREMVSRLSSASAEEIVRADGGEVVEGEVDFIR